jgi:hypothetical protein
LEPFDLAMISIYFVLEQQNFKTFKDGIDRMLVALSLDHESLCGWEQINERKALWEDGVQILREAYS